MREEIVIDEVRDLDAAWPELSLLFMGLNNYHKPYFPRSLRDDWETRWRDYVALGDDRLILIAREGAEAIAYLSVQVRRDYGIFDELVGFIDDAFVVEDNRGQGVGRAMLRRAEEWLRSRGVNEVRLQTVAANKRAVRFWTLSGFELQSMTMRKALV